MTIPVHGLHPDDVPVIQNTRVATSDTLVRGPGLVFWMSVSAGATGGALQLNNSLDDSGTDLFDITMPATRQAHFLFIPPLEFNEGIYLDIPGTNITVTVGYAP